MREWHVWDWVLVFGLLALAFVIGLDALRGADGEPTPTSSSSASATRAPACAREDIAIGIEILGGLATNVVRQVGAAPCHLRLLGIHLTITDRTGEVVWNGRQQRFFGGNLAPGEYILAIRSATSDWRVYPLVLD